MTDQQWKTLVAIVRGEAIHPLPTAFIIDSPWLPNWAGHTILDYFTDESIFLNDNLQALRTFPEAIFVPGFWSEYGMCTEPSAFGSVSIWGENEFPFARKALHSPAEVERLQTPDPRKHGLQLRLRELPLAELGSLCRQHCLADFQSQPAKSHQPDFSHKAKRKRQNSFSLTRFPPTES